VLGWQRADGATILLAGSANYEDGLATGSGVRQYDLARHMIDDSLPGTSSSSGPLALADMDGDGTLELFIGGRVLPGRYPEPADSRVYRQKANQWVLDADKQCAVGESGSGECAVWSDLNGDGFPD